MKKKNQETTAIELSVVIPVDNKEAVLTKLFDRLYTVLDKVGSGYEVVFVDDGSRDRSATLLRQQYKLRPDVTRVLLLRNHAGQQAAIMAGFGVSKGDRVVTLGADLQNPPEEIPRLLEEMDRGHDYVGGLCRRHHETKWWDLAFGAMNLLRERVTRIQMTDQGCMLRAYDREIVDAVLCSEEANTFIPALAYVYASNPTEIEVAYAGRAEDDNKYMIYDKIHCNFDLMTGFSLAPLQIFSLVGIGASLVSFAFAIFLVIRRLVVGPEVEGVFTLLGILFFFLGVMLFGIGLLGEYVGHICKQSRGRPSYLVREHLRPKSDSLESERKV